MFNLKNLFARALLALMLATGAAAASAGPIYHVTIDTQGMTGTGFFDFLLLGDASTAAPATFTLSNFTGLYGLGVTDGDASGNVGSNVIMGNADGYAHLLQAVTLGGVFGFNLEFAVGLEGDASVLGIALINEAMDAYLGMDGDLAQFELAPSGLVISPDNVFVSISPVSEVPEPAAMALLALGLMILGWTMRQRGMR